MIDLAHPMHASVGASITSSNSKITTPPATINHRNRCANDFGWGVVGPHEERPPPSPLFLDSPPDMINYYGGEISIKNIPCCCKTGPGPGLLIVTGTDAL